MALDVWIQPSRELSLLSKQGTHILSFDEDEGDYWFLWPLFQKLWSQTGQIIDLYEVAVFGGTELNALAQTIETAIQLTQAQPEMWNVVTGRTTGANSRDISVPISKPKLLTFLEQLQMAVSEAREEDHYIIFLGD